MCQWSRLPVSTFRYRDPTEDQRGFVSDVADACRRYGVRVIIPGHDEGEALTRHADALPSGVSIAAAGYQSLHRANDKAIVADRALELGVPIAPIVRYEDLDSLAAMTNPSQRYVARTRRSNSSKGFLCAYGGHGLAEGVKSLIDRYSLPASRFPVVQEFVEGAGWGVSCLYWDGEPICHFTHRRIEEKIASGGTSTLRTGESNSLLEQYAHSLLRDMKWHGLAMVEFKYDSKSGRGWFVEINPRLWGSLDLAIQSGVNFAYLAYLASTEGAEAARKAIRPRRDGVAQMWLLGDMIRRIDACRRGRFSDALKLRNLVHAHHFDDLKLDDPLAFFGELAYYLGKFLRRGSLNPVDKGMVS